jgi:Ca2+/Na+ antiporter
MAMGDLLGSIVANSTLILGLAAVIRPLTLTNKGLIPYSLAIIVFVVMYIAFTIFVKSKRRLDWWKVSFLFSCSSFSYFSKTTIFFFNIF